MRPVPYGVSFTKKISVPDDAHYFNECCYGGDVVADVLLPVIEPRYDSVRSNQEDWGWFIWFRDGAASLAIDIFCDDPKVGEFRLDLTSRTKRWLVFDSVDDLPELERIKDIVLTALKGWVDGFPRLVRLDDNYT